MTPRTKKQNEEIRLQRLEQIRKAAADVYLNKGPLLEIRDVATQAKLGYGTVYHYYSNKGDLLYDLLSDALERLEKRSELKTATTTNSQSLNREIVVTADHSQVAVYSIWLLNLWAEDHALYLLFKLAGEEFDSLPQARSTSLMEAFRYEVLTPLASLMNSGVEPSDRLHHAEMLIAALVGCASLSIRRGRLHEEAKDIVIFLKL